MAYTLGQVVGTVDCEYCGEKHPAEFSHLSEHGDDHPVFAAVCNDLTAYYTTEGVTFK